jgi:hypothetical protein
LLTTLETSAWLLEQLCFRKRPGVCQDDRAMLSCDTPCAIRRELPLVSTVARLYRDTCCCQRQRKPTLANHSLSNTLHVDWTDEDDDDIIIIYFDGIGEMAKKRKCQHERASRTFQKTKRLFFCSEPRPSACRSIPCIIPIPTFD